MGDFGDLGQEIIAPKDISAEFMTSDGAIEFADFLRTQRSEPSLSITVDWPGELRAYALKAFLHDNVPEGQTRSATIRCTVEQRRIAANAFQSGVKWEKI